MIKGHDDHCGEQATETACGAADAAYHCEWDAADSTCEHHEEDEEEHEGHDHGDEHEDESSDECTCPPRNTDLTTSGDAASGATAVTASAFAVAIAMCMV